MKRISFLILLSFNFIFSCEENKADLESKLRSEHQNFLSWEMFKNKCIQDCEKQREERRDLCLKIAGFPNKEAFLQASELDPENKERVRFFFKCKNSDPNFDCKYKCRKIVKQTRKNLLIKHYSKILEKELEVREKEYERSEIYK